MTTVSGEICTVDPDGLVARLRCLAGAPRRRGGDRKSLYLSTAAALRQSAASCARYNRPMERALLRGATAARFLARYWQQRPLLIRRAIDGFRGILSWRESIGLALRGDCVARLAGREGGHSTLPHGPVRRRDFTALPQ